MNRRRWPVLALVLHGLCGVDARADSHAELLAVGPTEVVASAPLDIAITVYRDDLALVRETREVDLPGGATRVRFAGVHGRIVAASAVVSGLAVVERDYDYALLSPQSLLASALGETVTVRRQDGPRRREEVATIAAGAQGVVLRYADRAEAFDCSGTTDALSFARAPPNLRPEPTLAVNLRDAPVGKQVVTLTYLVGGVRWQTDYDLELGPTPRLSAWLTIANDAQQTLPDAQVAVIAGDLARVYGGSPAHLLNARPTGVECWPDGTTTSHLFARPRPPSIPQPMEDQAEAAGFTMLRMAAPAAPPPPPPEPRREAIGDYHLYRLAERTDVLAAQRKQLMLLQPRSVRLERLYLHKAGAGIDSADAPQPTTILLRAPNDAEHGLGLPLPAGTLRVYEQHRDAGPLLTQIAETTDTAERNEWRVEIGASEAVSVRTRVVEASSSERWFRPGSRRQVAYEHRLRNTTAERQTIEFVQTADGALPSTPRIDRASERFVIKDGLPTWTIALAPDADITLSYRATFDVE